MSAKLEKIGAEWKRALKRAADWTAKAKELERKYKEEENIEIHDLVHQAQLTPDQLAEVLKALSVGAIPSPAILPDEIAPADAEPEAELEIESEDDFSNED
jgi:hypothetical protein